MKERTLERVSAGCARPTLWSRLDSRFRGNDREECPPEADRGFGGVHLGPSLKLAYTRVPKGVQRGSPPQADAEGLGVSPNFYVYPPRMGDQGG